jgi:hypothetical protein
MNFCKAILLLVASSPIFAPIFAQGSHGYQSTVVFKGNKTNVLSALFGSQTPNGILSTGESVACGCDHGSCYFQIRYKGQNAAVGVGENYDKMKIYEYDFGGNGDKEIVVQVDLRKIAKNGDYYPGETTDLYVFRYSKGLIQKIFQKEIGLFTAVISPNYIELYSPSGLSDGIWHYYKGRFYEMVPVELRN